MRICITTVVESGRRGDLRYLPPIIISIWQFSLLLQVPWVKHCNPYPWVQHGANIFGMNSSMLLHITDRAWSFQSNQFGPIERVAARGSLGWKRRTSGSGRTSCSRQQVPSIFQRTFWTGGDGSRGCIARGHLICRHVIFAHRSQSIHSRLLVRI